jgi:hypothetical protein
VCKTSLAQLGEGGEEYGTYGLHDALPRRVEERKDGGRRVVQ